MLSRKRRTPRGCYEYHKITVSLDDSYDWQSFHTATARDKATSVGAWLAQCGRERVQQQDREDARWDRQEARRKAKEARAAALKAAEEAAGEEKP